MVLDSLPREPLANCPIIAINVFACDFFNIVYHYCLDVIVKLLNLAFCKKSTHIWNQRSKLIPCFVYIFQSCGQIRIYNFKIMVTIHIINMIVLKPYVIQLI